MATSACLENIKGKKPPTYCGDSVCGSIQGDINEYCSHSGLGGDVPVPQALPSGKCWCCCSCVAWGTPIEVSPGLYRPVEAINAGMTVMTTGGAMSGWEDREVSSIGGIAPGVPLDFCYTVFFLLTDGTQRIIVSTADHLYLVPGGTLKPIQHLRPKDQVVQADGGFATVATILVGQFSGGVRNFALGDFDPQAHPDDPYKGHLVNTFGLVTADLAVQMAYYGEQMDNSLLARVAEDLPAIGSARFHENYDTTLYNKVIRSPEMWPRGFKAHAPSFITPPPSALAYFTPDQASDLLEASTNQNIGNSEAVARFKYLRNVFRGFFPGLYYIADWTEETPNAWYFNEIDQSYIVLSGGLLRLDTLDLGGLSIILSHLVAQSKGYGCTGDADYWGAALFLREVWFDALYFEMFAAGCEEIAATFALIKPEHAGENPDNICAQPSLDCRLTAIGNAGRFGGVPDCAKPPPAFGVAGAEACGLEEVKVSFTAAVFPGTATYPGHYTIAGVTVLQARMDADPKVVFLSVQGMRPSTSYTVVVANVISESGSRLDPQHNSATFRTS